MTRSGDAAAHRAALEAEVLAANQSFYDAFSSGDLSAMSALWAQEAPVACLHPGMPALIGRTQVLQSWAQILNQALPAPMIADRPTVQLLGDTALVLCYERNGNNPAHLAATNIFVWESDAWRMVHHQAGPLNRPIQHTPAQNLN